jgi:hypothetical protein
MFSLIVVQRASLGLLGLKGLIVLHTNNCQQFSVTLTSKPMVVTYELIMAENFKLFE